MEITRKTLFESETLQIGLFEARPRSDKSGDVEWQSLNAVVLPFSGVFSKHEGRGRQVTGTPSNAVFVAANVPYRTSFPGAIGDRALILRFNEHLAPELLDTSGGRETVASHGLLPAKAMMLRNLLHTRLNQSGADRFELEAQALNLLDLSLGSLRHDAANPKRSELARRMRALSRVKEAVAVAPAEKWNIRKLAKVASMSPFHLCHVFRQMAGTSLYDYVLRERLACSLSAVLDAGNDLTTIALDAGFASHSHFTARFRTFFGCTPAAFRRLASTSRVANFARS